MRCPECGTDTFVIDSRRHFRGETIRRRRECWNQHRFTTYELLVTRVAHRHTTRTASKRTRSS